MNKKILVVDDERGIRDLLTFVLKARGFDVCTACNGVEGLEMAKKEQFEMIFLDVHMPLMNGLEMLRQIKELRPQQFVVVFSSASDPGCDLQKSATALGADHYILKPFNLDEIFRIVEKKGDFPPGK